MEKQQFKVMVDGMTVQMINVDTQDCRTVIQRDMLKKQVAEHHGISPRGMRLVKHPPNQPYEPHIYITDMKTQTTKRKYI